MFAKGNSTLLRSGLLLLIISNFTLFVLGWVVGTPWQPGGLNKRVHTDYGAYVNLSVCLPKVGENKCKSRYSHRNCHVSAFSGFELNPVHQFETWNLSFWPVTFQLVGPIFFRFDLLYLCGKWFYRCIFRIKNADIWELDQ